MNQFCTKHCIKLSRKKVYLLFIFRAQQAMVTHHRWVTHCVMTPFVALRGLNSWMTHHLFMHVWLFCETLPLWNASVKVVYAEGKPILSRACVFWIQMWGSLTQNCVHMRQRKKLYLRVIQIHMMRCYLIWREINKKLNRKTPKKQHKKRVQRCPMKQKGQ